MCPPNTGLGIKGLAKYGLVPGRWTGGSSLPDLWLPRDATRDRGVLGVCIGVSKLGMCLVFSRRTNAAGFKV